MEILKRINIKKGNFFEIGVCGGIRNNGTECNTIILLMLGWNGIWIDGVNIDLNLPENGKLNFIKEFINKANCIETFNNALKKSQIKKSIDKKIPILLELDVKGALAIQKIYPDQTVSIFIEPPSINDLKIRLKKRGSDSDKIIAKRLQRIDFELSHKSNFDFTVVNDKLEVATNQILEIIKNETKGVSYVT